MDNISQYSEASLREVGIEEWLDEDYVEPITKGQSVNSFLDDCEYVSSIEESDLIQSSASVSRAQETYFRHERMRKKLTYHFMNPIEKWQEKRRFPWKLCIQIIKIIVITLQMTLFGINSHSYVRRHQEVTAALGHIFLLDWTPNFASYPPSSGPYAVFTVDEFYAHVDNVVKQYAKVSTFPIGSFSYDNPNGTMVPLNICIDRYEEGEVSPFSATVNIVNVVEHHCLEVPAVYPASDPRWENFSTKEFLETSNMTINFATLLQMKLNFSLKTILIKSLSTLDIPECYELQLDIVYDNHHHDGQVKISFLLDSDKINCNIYLSHIDDLEGRNYVGRQLLNSIVIILCLASVILCARSLYSSYKLKVEAMEFFKEEFNRPLPVAERLDFVDFWYVMIVVSDILVIAGSLIKIHIEENHQNGMLYSQCCMLLGVGNLLVWVGILRYLGFFKKYNMLILTLKCALPNVMRFLLCAVFLYAGFCFCGWIVLGPYHVKFESLSRTSECLFAVMNGDDMFATFVLLNYEDNALLWWFSRVYLYSFLILFVYVVISLFISVIMDTFETIKFIYVHGTPPKTTIELFVYGDLQKSQSQQENKTQNQTITMLKTVFIKILSRLRPRTSNYEVLPNRP